MARLVAVDAIPELGEHPPEHRGQLLLLRGRDVTQSAPLDRFIYDLWGDSVNVASRMESSGVIDRIQVTGAVVARVRDSYGFELRDPIEIKGKGPITTYLLPPGRSRFHGHRSCAGQSPR